MFVFRKIWYALFSWNTHFETRPFALLPTILWCPKKVQIREGANQEFESLFKLILKRVHMDYVRQLEMTMFTPLSTEHISFYLL